MTRKTRTKFFSGVAEAVHETACGLHRLGLIDQESMREFDASCLSAIEPLSGPDIQAIREREGISQADFARHLNVGTKLVSDWERGAKRPSGPSLKLLAPVKVKGLETIA